MDTQFYLTLGALEHLSERKSLFNACAQVSSKKPICNTNTNPEDHQNINYSINLSPLGVTTVSSSSSSSSSSSVNTISSDNVTFRFVNNNSKPIVQVTEVQCFQGLSADDVRYGVKLFDGLGELSCSLDPSMYHMLTRSQDPTQEQLYVSDVACVRPNTPPAFNLMCGSVILLNEYKLVDLCDLLSRDELEATDTNQRDIRVVCLVDFILLGHSTIRAECDTILDNNDDDDDDDDVDLIACQEHQELPTTSTTTTSHSNHIIAELDNTYSKIEWSIKCKLVNRTMIREFENRRNGSKGHVCRLLLLDTSGLIELVAFNKFCFDDQIKQMKINCFYLIKNGDVKAAKLNVKAWPDQLSVQYEIQCTLQTKIVEVVVVDQTETLDSNLDEASLVNVTINEKEKLPAQKSSKSSPTTTSTTTTTTKSLAQQQPHPQPEPQKQQQNLNASINLSHLTPARNFTSTTNSRTRETTSASNILHEKFTQFNLLFSKKPKCLVDIIGIVSAVGDCQTTKISKSNAELSVRKVQLVDNTNISVSVAFWGKQAEQFDHKIGTCLMMNKVQVTNYNGLSLSVLRMTEIMVVKREYDIQKANELIDWWQSTVCEM